MTAANHNNRRRTIVSGRNVVLPPDVTGVRWPDNTIECRARLDHAHGSLASSDGEVGEVLTGLSVACDNCSDACSP